MPEIEGESKGFENVFYSIYAESAVLQNYPDIAVENSRNST
jgi:hypothetical protein